MSNLKSTDIIYVAGHQGMVGSAVVRQLEMQGCLNIITQSSSELDLTDQTAVHDFFTSHEIDAVFLAAAKVGGIHAKMNTQPSLFIKI